MKFLALFKKEWRESAPFVLAAMLALAVLGFGLLRVAAPWMAAGVFDDQNHQGREIHTYYHYPFGEVAGIVWMVSLGLGLGLGVRHFWEPTLTKTWAFQIHRSASRAQILSAKLLCAALAIQVLLGGVWAGVYAYSHVLQQAMIRPPYSRILVDGYIYVSFGLVVYLATALAGLMSTRWYTTRFFCFVWAFLIFMCVVQSSLAMALIWLVAGLLVLIVLLWDQFKRREFA